MGHFSIIPGSNALSDFRAANLKELLGADVVRAIWIHYVDLYYDLSGDAQRGLTQLLQHGPTLQLPDDECGQALQAVSEGKAGYSSTRTRVFFVIPRLGTISPWSSKATSIAQVSGLGRQVKRIERGMAIAVTQPTPFQPGEIPSPELLHDRMTQTISAQPPEMSMIFAEHSPTPARAINLREAKRTPREVLEEANRMLGLALDSSELHYLESVFGPGGRLARNPSDVELFMFAQVNSEHCRHKQFNAEWIIDDIKMPHSLFGMIKSTHQRHPRYTVSAYTDNAAVFEGADATSWEPAQLTGEWTSRKEFVHFIAKVETHNHPTAISPYPGAATGSGGEIRDEGSVGRGSKPKAGLVGFSVSDLLIPGYRRPWELDVGKPNHIASSLDIMLEAPVGAAAFNNEFGRPCTTGYFRTILTRVALGDGSEELRGYHKPIMLAGGVGTVRPQHAKKDARLVIPGAFVIVLGGPAMLVGLGGGSTSSLTSGDVSVDLDFASVQRGNPEVQRKAQMVIDTCTAMGDHNPIALIHDVGAGGLSNALPELVHDAGSGAQFELREIESVDQSLSPLAIWCCEAQERYVMIVNRDRLPAFEGIAKRERSGYSIIGQVTGKPQDDNRLVLTDRESQDRSTLVDLPMSVLFGHPPQMTKTVQSRTLKFPRFDCSLTSHLPKMSTNGLLQEAVNRVLTLPAVGSKSFLITIGDRSVGGLVVRDQMVGRWQVPVADVSVTASSLMAGISTGEAMAMGERPMLALISPAASARMAVAEALTNLAAADTVDRLDRVRLSANWMAASGHPGEGAALYEAVQAITLDLCPRSGLSIPVGKDSMSMKMKWQDPLTSQTTEVTAPLSLVVTAFAPVAYISKTWTPALRRLEDVGESTVFFVDLAEGMRAIGGSALAQVFGEVGDESPDLRNVQLLKDYFDAIQQLHEASIVLAYHDRSDGGLLTTLVEMMFAGRCGLDILIDDLTRSSHHRDLIEALFTEELGGVFQVRKRDEVEFQRCFATCGPPPGLIKKIGRVPIKSQQRLMIQYGVTTVFTEKRSSLQQQWASTSYALQRLRDNPVCADAEHAAILNDSDCGLSYDLTFNVKENILSLRTAISAAVMRKPRVAILREQGINGHAEMAFAFHQAGFSAIDVHMTDLLSGRVSLSSFTGLAACGGFSYGDVLGAGQGWAKSVLLHDQVRRQFQAFFERKDTFTLGVCNGAQFLARLTDLIPGTSNWPLFERNESEQYEARLCMVEILDGEASGSGGGGDVKAPCVFFHGMHGSKFPIVVAHAEGRAVFSSPPPPLSSPSSPPPPPSSSLSSSSGGGQMSENVVAMRFIDHNTLQPTETYPFNPNGSKAGVTAVRSIDGRVLAMMPHPERMILRDAVSWAPSSQMDQWGELGPWSRLFRSARRWVG